MFKLTTVSVLYGYVDCLYSAFAQEGKIVSPQLLRSQREALCDYLANEDAQGITEYGAILSFVAILVALAFGFYNGSLSQAVSKAFSSVVSQLENMSAAAANSSWKRFSTVGCQNWHYWPFLSRRCQRQSFLNRLTVCKIPTKDPLIISSSAWTLKLGFLLMSG